jgi:predicted nucleic acid-binding protein
VEVRIIVDTNRYRDFCAGVAEAVECFQSAEQISIPFVTIAGLRAGFLAGNAGKRNAKVLSIFLNRARVRTLWPDEETTQQYARIWLQRRSRFSTTWPCSVGTATSIVWRSSLARELHDAARLQAEVAPVDGPVR